MSLTENQVNVVVEVILDELSCRKGIGDELDQIEFDSPDIYEEMVSACRQAVIDVTSGGTRDTHEKLYALENAVLEACWKGTELAVRDNCRLCYAPETRPHYTSNNGTLCPGGLLEEHRQEAYRTSLYEAAKSAEQAS